MRRAEKTFRMSRARNADRPCPRPKARQILTDDIACSLMQTCDADNFYAREGKVQAHYRISDCIGLQSRTTSKSAERHVDLKRCGAGASPALRRPMQAGRLRYESTQPVDGEVGGNKAAPARYTQGGPHWTAPTTRLMHSEFARAGMPRTTTGGAFRGLAKSPAL